MGLTSSMEGTTRILLSDVTIEPIDKVEDLSHFSCTEEQLNAFLFEDALEDHNNLYSITRVVKYHSEVVGFFTLIADNINLKLLPESSYSTYHYIKMPAVKIARLATDERYERRGIGNIMLRYIFNIIDHISHFVGCRIVTVDAKRSAVGFYKKIGFQEVHSKRYEDYIPLYLDFKHLRDIRYEENVDEK